MSHVINVELSLNSASKSIFENLSMNKVSSTSDSESSQLTLLRGKAELAATSRRTGIPIPSLRDEVIFEEDFVPLQQRIQNMSLEVRTYSRAQPGIDNPHSGQDTDVGAGDGVGASGWGRGRVGARGGRGPCPMRARKYKPQKVSYKDGGSPTWSTQESIMDMISSCHLPSSLDLAKTPRATRMTFESFGKICLLV